MATNCFHGSQTWVDDAVVYRVLNGQSVDRRLTIAERRVLVEELFHRGYSQAEAARLIGVAEKTVTRILKRLGLKESDRDVHPYNGRPRK